VPFLEVRGLETETQVIECRAGNNKVFFTLKIPGLAKISNVTLKKGLFVKDNKLFDWYSQIKMNLMKRSTVVIKLCDEGGNPTMTWTMNNAWPCKIQGTDLNAHDNEVAVETLEIAYETLVIASK
jgi:phage tail-like protein